MSGTRPTVRVASAEIVRHGRYLLTQRAAHAVLPLLWEFPGGRVRAGESDAEALQRSLLLRLGIEVLVGELVLEVTHVYDTYDLHLAVYRCALGGAVPKALKVADLAWVEPEQFGAYSFPGADQKTVELLLSEE